MSELVWGDVDWNNADVGENGNSVEFMRLSEGANVVRILGNPVQFYVNWVTLPDGRKRKINSPEEGSLIRKLEDAGFKRQTRWLLKVLDRRDNKFKMLEVGSQIFTGIKDLVNNKKWGKVTGYDITINRGPKGKQPLYSVQPDPKEPLDSALKQSFIEFNDGLNIERLISPSDTQYVCELMGWPVPTTAEVDSEDPFATEEDGASEFDYDFD